MRGCDVCGRVYGERGAATDGRGTTKKNKKQNLSRKGWVLRMATARLLSGGCGAPFFSLKSRLFLKTHQNIGKSNYNFETTFSLPFKLLFFGGGIEILIIYSCTRTYPGDPDPHQWSGYVLQYTFSLLDAYHNTLHGSCPVYISTLVRNEKWELGELSVRHGVANCCWLQTVERADTCNVAAWLIHQQRSLRLTIYPDTRCLFFLRSEGGEETFTSGL